MLPQHPHPYPLDDQGLPPQIDLDGRELGVLGEQPHPIAAAAEALDGDLVFETRHYDLAVRGLGRDVHGQEIAVQDPGIAHAHPPYPQEIIGMGLEQLGVHVVVGLDVLFGQDGVAGGHPAHHRQSGWPIHQQSDPARGAGQERDRPLAFQCPQVVLGGVRRSETEFIGDLRARRREPLGVDEPLDHLEDLVLAEGQCIHGVDGLYESTAYCRAYRHRCKSRPPSAPHPPSTGCARNLNNRRRLPHTPSRPSRDLLAQRQEPAHPQYLFDLTEFHHPVRERAGVPVALEDLCHLAHDPGGQ